MSHVLALISRTLDLLQAWGGECIVAPDKLVDGKRPAIQPQRHEGPVWGSVQAVFTFVVLWGILVSWAWAPAGGTGFIYAEF